MDSDGAGSGGRQVVAALALVLRARGYRTWVGVLLNAADYGVPRPAAGGGAHGVPCRLRPQARPTPPTGGRRCSMRSLRGCRWRTISDGLISSSRFTNELIRAATQVEIDDIAYKAHDLFHDVEAPRTDHREGRSSPASSRRTRAPPGAVDDQLDPRGQPSTASWCWEDEHGNKRRVTVEEAGVLQSFPQDYRDGQSARTSQFGQVGNGPALIAAAIISQLLT